MLLRRSWKRSTKVTTAIIFLHIVSSSVCVFHYLKTSILITFPHALLCLLMLASKCAGGFRDVAFIRRRCRVVISKHETRVLIFTVCPSGLLTLTHSSVCHPAAAVDASFRAAQEGPAMERDRQHCPHRRSEPDPDGSQRPERSLCQVQTGEPEIQEQSMFLCNVYLMFWRAFERSSMYVCVCLHRQCQRPWVHSGGSSLTFICMRRAEECWRSLCGTETLGGGMISLDGQSHDHNYDQKVHRY